MRIAIDISPISSGHYLQHKVRGTGFYLESLKKSLLKYHPENEYFFLKKEEYNSTQVDLIHIPYFEPFFLTLPQRIDKKIVVTVHDLTPLVFPTFFPKGIRGSIKWFLQKKALKKTSHIITDSESSKYDISNITGIEREKISVVYLAAGEQFVQLKKNDPELIAIRKKYKLFAQEFVLYVGDVTWNKNLPRVFNSIFSLKIPLVVIGKAIAEDEFDSSNSWNQDLVKVRKMIEKNPSISLLGYIPEKDLIALYNIATLLVMPSLYEGFGLPILEAMSCGCPVVTSKKGSLKEVAGSGAYLVDPYDEEDISEGIKKVFFSDSMQKNLKKKGIEQAKKFSWKKVADQTVTIYEKTLGNIS